LQHKNKENRLKNNKIKQISLFFVPQVSDFINQNDDGIVKQLFLQEYKNIYNQEAQGKYAYYFSETAKVKGTKDTQEKEMTKLILKDREELLSLDNPVEFIFAHTSLGVGWDNPNIFNICFLRYITSESNKKQFVGRGLRLCVNSEGKRVFESKEEVKNEVDRINNLTIIGSMQYESFCSDYQKEAGWSKESQSKIGNAKNKQAKTITIKNDKKELAKELWKRLKTKTKWYINFNDLDKFYQSIITELQNSIINQKQISITKGDIQGNFEDFQAKEIIEELNINQIIVKIKQKTWLSVNEIKQILSQIDQNQIKKNQEAFVNLAIEIIERCKKNHIMSVAEVKYEATGNSFDDEHFVEEEKVSYHENLIESEKSLFNLVDCDSNQEKKFVQLVDKTPNVELLVKLPKGSEDKFHINTPIGKYTPDFALLINNSNKLYMIFEVKSKKPNDLSEEEKFKIQCAIKHFEQLGFETEPKYIDHKSADFLEISKLQQDLYSVYIPNAK